MHKYVICTGLAELRILLRGKSHAYFDCKIDGSAVTLLFPTEEAKEAALDEMMRRD